MKHAEGKFTGSNKLNLYWQSWVPEGTPVAVLLIVHGLAEHSGRYTNPVNYFVPKSYAVYSFDLPGHGKSDGKRGYVERFSNYVDDVKTYYDMVKQQNKDTKIFLVGHSMGGTIATAYAGSNTLVMTLISCSFFLAGLSSAAIWSMISYSWRFFSRKRLDIS